MNKTKYHRFIPFSLTGIITLSAITLLTGFISLHGAEYFFGTDIAFAQSYKSLDLSSVSQHYGHTTLSGEAYSIDGGRIELGKPQYIVSPSNARDIELVDPVHTDNDDWLARQNTGHYIVPIDSENATPAGDLIVYMRSNFRTIGNPQEIASGDVLSIKTDKKWEVRYKVVKIQSLHPRHIAINARNSDKAQLVLLLFKDNSQNEVIVVEGDLDSIKETR